MCQSIVKIITLNLRRDYCAQNRDVDECEPQTRHPAPSEEQESQPGC